jgi:hypothetical protein
MISCHDAVTSRDGSDIYITNWSRYQNVQGMDSHKEKARIRNIEYRKRRKMALLTSRVTSCDVAVTPVELELDLDKKEGVPVDKQPASKKVREKKPVPEGYAEFTRELFKLNGGHYVFTSKDGALIKRVVATLGTDEAIRRLRLYYTTDHWFTKDGRSIAGFQAHVNEMGNGKAVPSPKAKCEACGGELTAGFCYNKLPSGEVCGWYRGRVEEETNG